MVNSPAGFPTSQLEARGAEGHTWLLASSSSPPVVPPLHSTHKVTEAAQTLEASLYAATCVRSTFDVNSWQDVLEGGGVEQVAHFFLGLRFASTMQERSFRKTKQYMQPQSLTGYFTVHAAHHATPAICGQIHSEIHTVNVSGSRKTAAELHTVVAGRRIT